jgi:phospholipase/carboxylesterase
MLHGRSGNEDAMWIFSKVLPKDWLVLAPRGIKPDLGGGFAWHPRQRDEWPSLAMFDEAVEALLMFIDALPELYGVDPSRLYLMGFSQGAAAAYAVAMRRPKTIKGIAGLVGFVPVNTEKAIETVALKDLPIFMAVGEDDPYISLSRTQGCATTLKASGADLTYKVYETGHRISAQGMRDLRDWWRDVAAGS